jgi:GNAT superfamily N-acetyltransferase
MSDIRIIPLAERPEFADACAAWSYAEWGSQVETRRLSEVHESYKASADDNALPVTWVAVVDGKPAGMIRLKKIDHIEREDLTPWLSGLYVHPHYRGMGLGEALCNRVHKEAKETYGFDKIYLFTGDAAGLYRKLGYKDIGSVPGRADPSVTKNLMMKEL